MNLPTVQPNNELIQAVNARELYQFLNVGRDFSTWIKARIEKYEFTENVDYIRVTKSGEGVNTGFVAIEYFISLDMAKELCMVENNEQGRDARKYFIQCEKQLKQPQIPQTYAQALRAYADEVEQRQALQIENAELKPKAEALDVITHAKGNQNVRDTGKALDINQSKFVDWCLEHGWCYRDDSERLKAHQHRLNQGFMAQKPVLYKGSDGTERVTMQPMFTPKGITHLAKIHHKAVA